MAIQDYLKSLNPKTNLEYGSKYMLYREGEYVGIATWTEDKNIGDSFQYKKENGSSVVVIADSWVKINQA